MKYVHTLACLGFYLMNFNNGGMIGKNCSKSSLVVELKEKQVSHLVLLQLKKAVHKKNVQLLSYEKGGILRYQGRLCVPNIDGLRE